MTQFFSFHCRVTIRHIPDTCKTLYLDDVLRSCSANSFQYKARFAPLTGGVIPCVCRAVGGRFLNPPKYRINDQICQSDTPLPAPPLTQEI